MAVDIDIDAVRFAADALIGQPCEIAATADGVLLRILGPADRIQGHEMAIALSSPGRPVACRFASIEHGDGLLGDSFEFVPGETDADAVAIASAMVRYVLYPATRTYAQRRWDDSAGGPDECLGGGYAVMRFGKGVRGTVVGWGQTCTSAYRQARMDAGRRTSCNVSSMPEDIMHCVRELAA